MSFPKNFDDYGNCLMCEGTFDECDCEPDDWDDDDDFCEYDDEHDGQPDEAQEWYDFDPDC